MCVPINRYISVVIVINDLIYSGKLQLQSRGRTLNAFITTKSKEMEVDTLESNTSSRICPSLMRLSHCCYHLRLQQLRKKVVVQKVVVQMVFHLSHHCYGFLDQGAVAQP